MRRLLFTLTFLAACAHSTPHKPGDEYLRAIHFEGNQKLKSKTLNAGLGLNRTEKRGRAPDPYLVEVDADRIRGEYLRNGYLDVDVQSRVDRDGDAMTVTYVVEEGVRAKTRISIYGLQDDPELPEAKILAQLPLHEGDTFDYAKFDAAKVMLLQVVQDAGYAHAKLDATVFADRPHHEAIIQLDYALGPKCTFGEIKITGVKPDLADAARNRMQFATGDRYSTSAIIASKRALYGFGRFSTVQIQPDQTAGAVVGIEVAVAEGARREIKLGGGVGVDPTAFEVRARMGYTIAGWPFPLDTVTLEARPAYAYMRDGSGYQPRMRAIAKLERQDLFWTYAKGDVEVGYNYLAVEAYTSTGPHTRLGFQTPLRTPKLQLRVTWGLEQLAFSNISPLIDPALQMEIGLDHAQRNGTYQQSLILDLRDHPLQPRLGAYAALHVVEGTVYAGGAYEYFQLVPDLRGYVPLGPVVMAARLRFGSSFGDVPVTERYFSGGASNHRGFGERSLSPFVTGDVDGTTRSVPFGGTAMLETGIEARIPLTTWRKIGIGTVLFLDAGDVTRTQAELDLSNLHWAAGVGLRFLTIVGPIRADLGYRLNRFGAMDPQAGSRLAFHMSFGEAF